MTVFENLTSKNIDELAEWLSKYGQDFSPWDNWFDKNYCEKCDTVIRKNAMGAEHEYAWCELNGKCKFFKNMDTPPWGKEVVKLWLESDDMWLESEV